jgi:hypothetical protein
MPEPLQAIPDEVFLSLKHPLQPRRFALALFFALLLFPLIAAGLVAGTVVLIVPFFGFLLWLSGRVFYSHFLGNSILASEMNYPRIYRIGEDLKAAIGYKKKVDIFVYEQGNFNAYLLKFFFHRRAVFLNSELLEAGVTDDELRWLIGRFVGYLRARRRAGFWGWTIRAAQHLLVFNLFLLPYERALVYTGDRIALAVITGDISSAISAMQKIFVGRQLGYSVNPNGLVDQHRLVKGSIFAFLARLSSGFPHMTARYVDLIGFARERFPAQFERFEAENPGLPLDLQQLTALPQADAVRLGAKDPVWAPLAGALALLALLTFVSVKVIVPRVSGRGSSAIAALAPAAQESPAASTPAVPLQSDTATATPQPQPDTAQESPAAPSPAGASQSDAAPAAPQEQPYISTAGRFSVHFPGPPTQNAGQVSLSGGESMTLHRFSFEEGNSVYMVMYNDYPPQYAASQPQPFLESIRDGVAGKATLTADRPIDFNGVPGRIFKFTNEEGTTLTELVLLDGQRLYQVMVAVSAGSSATHAEDFLNSFRIL